VKILLEMRPALDGHAGIPQEARLLFRGLSTLPDLEVQGLLQSSNRVISRGLPVQEPAQRRLSNDRRVHMQSRVVISLKTTEHKRFSERWGERWRNLAAPSAMIGRRLLGRAEPLGVFHAEPFSDFVWRDLFARTLPVSDHDVVARADFRVSRVPWNAMHLGGLITRRLGRAVYPRLDTRGFDVMIAETPYPGEVAPGTRMVVRYHDAIPLLMPHTITDKAFHSAAHYNALKRNVDSGAWFACVSESTRQDLLRVFPEVEPRAVTIHNMVSHHYHAQDECSPERIHEIVRTRRNVQVKGVEPDAARWATRPLDYLLMVSTVEPRKNHATLLAAWEQLRVERYPDLKLVIVGGLGWDHAPIVKRFAPWLARGEVQFLEEVPAAELRLLYRHARATVCPSYGEGFDFSGIEAMRCGGAVIASDIPVHRDVFGDACEYFNTYDSQDLAAAITRVVDPTDPAAMARQAELVARGEQVSARYLPEVVLPQWREFLLGLPKAG
jgi:glycosyltransferase involved in cell wall biosynthesis